MSTDRQVKILTGATLERLLTSHARLLTCLTEAAGALHGNWIEDARAAIAAARLLELELREPWPDEFIAGPIEPPPGPTVGAVDDYSGPLVEARNSIDPLSQALASGEIAKAKEIAERMRRCIDQVIEWADKTLQEEASAI